MDKFQVKLDKFQENLSPNLDKYQILIKKDDNEVFDDFGLGILIGSLLTTCGYLIGLFFIL